MRRAGGFLFDQLVYIIMLWRLGVWYVHLDLGVYWARMIRCLPYTAEVMRV